MKILVIDRDTLSTQLIRSRLEALGHRVVEETVKNEALTRLEREAFDAVFIDPAPLNNARPLVLGVRRSAKSYLYTVLMSHDMAQEEAIRSGANDMLSKPLDAAHMEDMIGNVERLTGLIRRIGDESEDFPSAGGVIAKSAFNQLFLACIDRADRYGERSFLVFISVANYKEIVANEGAYSADYASAKLSQYLVRLRRQSDLIAQTGKGEFCLMLQRPVYETEPMEAAARFAEALGRLDDICATDTTHVQVAVRLVTLPVGELMAEHLLDFEKKPARSGSAG